MMVKMGIFVVKFRGNGFWFFQRLRMMDTVAVIAKVDCRVFCHIDSLGDGVGGAAAPIQPNPFWFWEKYMYIFFTFL